MEDVRRTRMVEEARFVARYVTSGELAASQKAAA